MWTAQTERYEWSGFVGQPVEQLRNHLAVAGNQIGNTVRQARPEELERNRLWAPVRRIAFVVAPRHGRLACAAEMVKAAVMYLVEAEVRHVTPTCAKESNELEARQPCFLVCLPQDGVFGPLAVFHAPGRNLNACFRVVGMAEYQQTVSVRDVSEHFMLEDWHMCCLER